MISHINGKSEGFTIVGGVSGEVSFFLNPTWFSFGDSISPNETLNNIYELS